MEGGSEERAGRSWWQTLPGTITAIAGLITAVTGLVIAVQQIWPSSDGSHAAVTASDTTVGSTTEGGGEQAASAYDVAFPGGRRALIGDLRYDVVAARAEAGNPGEVVLRLRVRLANEGQYAANFWNATFRLRAGEETSAPTNFLDEVVDARTTKTGEVVFALPASTSRSTLLVGDDPAKSVELPLVLAPSG